MQKHLSFLKVSSAVVKIAAWIFLFLGLLGGISLLFGIVPGTPRWMGVVILAFYIFIFTFLLFTAKIADLLVKVVNAIKLE
ncbi:MAG: hypothetical protein PHU59_03970 [Candidatus Omnitrophica bacterium]|jgi:hypothetical protein|nr:hypothetical protein [Candidatus Omnitrophota bacterium]